MKNEKSFRKTFLLIFFIIVGIVIFFSVKDNGLIDTLKIPSLFFCLLFIGFEIYKIFFSREDKQYRSPFFNDKRKVLLLLLLVIIGGIKTGYDFFEYYKISALVDYRSIFRVIFSFGLFIRLGITYISVLNKKESEKTIKTEV